jgi:uncharacterized protein YbbC (DUF1343 family)
MDAASVLKQLPELPGLRFSTASFSPTAPGHPYRNQGCNGIEITVTDPSKADPALAGLHLAQAIYSAHPTQYQVRSGFHTMQGDKTVWERLTKNREQPAKIITGWQEGIKQFRQLRQQYLLY